ncbi:MAG: 50S ribosomal protein L9 [Flavobacteriales bacterium]|jgi:large subunit ribosomal protein L9|nr:50S ribosomal protein L9 [Flavobacteriales bacterium]MDG1348785.1 50S ribosomal protein L9 [Flavobacteriales bacterium]|tara:strand:+ start:114 stop:557 length:444 start_codon:yes stop_codon:yes gene_type:complete
MDIILKENVEKLGFKNEIVSVKNGYGRNFLIPKGLGVLATESAIKVLNENLKQQAKKEETEIAAANKIAEALPKLEIVLTAKVADGGTKLFGSVKTSQFTDALAALGHTIDASFVKLPKVKELGKYEAEVRLHRTVSANVAYSVIAE